MRILKNPSIVIGSMVKELSEVSPRTGTVLSIYTDLHMREEVVTVSWQWPKGINSEFVTQVRRVR